MTTRGQAALEFLMTYGWALLAVLVAIAALAYFGFLSGSDLLPARCDMELPFSCVEYKVQTDGSVFLGIQNSVASVSFANLTLLCNKDPAQDRHYAHVGTLQAQSRLNDSLVRLNCPIQGDIFSADITIEYQNLGEETVHEATGLLRLPIEE